MSIYKSGEDYLEMILMLSKKKPLVRSIDIAHELGVSKPSVSVAMKKLRESGHITVADDGALSLTADGYIIAERMLERHTLLTELLMSLGVDEAVAREDACKLEHDLSEQSFEAIRAFMNARLARSDKKEGLS